MELSALQACKTKLARAGVNPSDRSAANAGTAWLTAPISGTVTAVYGRIGGVADLAQPVMAIVNTSGIYALLKIYESDLPKVRKGDEVEVSLTNGGGVMKGRVDEVVPAVDAVSRAIDVRVSLSDLNGCMPVPGMAVNAFISTGSEEVETLPEEAVVQLEGRDFIYVLEATEKHDGETFYRFRPSEVVRGTARGGFVEVRPVAPLPEDARIVVAKAFYLASMASDHGEHNH